MQARARQWRFALAFGVSGAVLVVFGRGLFLEAGPPPLLLAAWGLVTGAVIGGIAASLPQRATFPLGIGTLLAAAGFVAGTAYAVHVLGQDLPDGNPNQLLASGLVGAGVGWSVGAALGAVMARRAARFSARQAWLVRGIGLAALPIGTTLVWLRWLSVGSQGPTRYIGRSYAALVADALVVCLSLLLVAGGRHPATQLEQDRTRIGSRLTRCAVAFGVTMGCLVLIALLGSVLVTPRAVEHARQEQANHRTAESLIRAATRVMDRDGAYPGDVASLLAAGGKLQPGSVVTLVSGSGDRLCLTVGTDAGSGEGREPYWSASVGPHVTGMGLDRSGDDCVAAAAPVITSSPPA
jgi:hypothetical protein